MDIVEPAVDLLCASMVLVYIILMFQSKLASAGEAAAVPLRKSHQRGCIVASSPGSDLHCCERVAHECALRVACLV
jgi:hypothetical protein